MRIAESMIPTALHPSRHPHEYIPLHHFPQLINHMMAMRRLLNMVATKIIKFCLYFFFFYICCSPQGGARVCVYWTVYISELFVWYIKENWAWNFSCWLLFVGHPIVIIHVWWNFQPSLSLGRWNIFAFLLNVFYFQRQEHFKKLPCKAKTLCVKNFCCSACWNIWKYE